MIKKEMLMSISVLLQGSFEERMFHFTYRNSCFAEPPEKWIVNKKIESSKKKFTN